MIPFLGLKRQYVNLREEIRDVTDVVLQSGKILDGEHTLRFEQAIIDRTGREFGVAVNSCSVALLICYLYFKSRCHNKNILLPAVSFVASANAPTLAGQSLNFIDVDQGGMMDLDQIDLVRDNIGMVSYVNLFGNVLDYHKLKLITDFFITDDNEIPIIEDAAQSFGATYKGIPSGNLGHASCLSFDPTKNLPNYGSGGMILTNDFDLYIFALNFRDNGKNNAHQTAGTNCKMSETDCAQMLIKLRHFDAWQDRRAKIAKFYNECLFPYVDVPLVYPDVKHAWHKYVIRSVDRDALKTHLAKHDIETKVHYPNILPEYEFTAFDFTDRDFTNAITLSNESLSLPIYPEMTDSEVEQVVKHIQAFYD